MFRIGINVGDAMVKYDDLFGDGVNVAARLEALAAVDRAMRLDPRCPSDYMYVLGVARIGLDRFEEAVAALRRAHERSPEYPDGNIPLAAA